jgi:hypothetical protein
MRRLTMSDVVSSICVILLAGSYKAEKVVNMPVVIDIIDQRWACFVRDTSLTLMVAPRKISALR